MRVRKCGWCLYLGKERAYDVRELRLHFDTALVSGYLIGGMLERWLFEAGETEILSRVREIDYGGDVGEQLEHIFGVRPDRRTRLPACLLKKRAGEPISPFLGAGFVPNGSFFGGSYRSGSYRSGSFSLGSFRNGSFRAESYRIGSYRSGSYRLGSFRHSFEFEFERGSYRSGSYRVGSFRLTSFGKSGSFRVGSFRVGSFRSGSFRNGSFRYYAGNAEITESEYHRTLINLSSCPLNEYGYGIHLI